MEEWGEFPNLPSMAKKAGSRGGHPSKRRSWAILERWFSRSYLGFFQSFIFARPTGLKIEQVSAPLFQTFRKKKPIARAI